ncbi:TetR/AcrR family transcriptional regulator [Alkalicoccobacillus gibsonii]|uniref:TetR/AcrR family transcriptional regulator n=1 Tax=Alkalicoccobacillus gibsonii TaxID=79881 RepID=UPI003F7BD3E3
MTADEIKKAALFSFGQNGFEGASLAQIADEVGIKKQSIYTHFKNKDDLFLTVLEDSLENDWSFLVDWIAQNQEQSIHDLLEENLYLLIRRFHEEDSYRFGLRMSFFPPTHLNEKVMQQVAQYESKFEEAFMPRFQAALSEDLIEIENARSGVLAYLSIVDAIFIELVYGNKERAQMKLKASWSIFWRGVVK